MLLQLQHLVLLIYHTTTWRRDAVISSPVKQSTYWTAWTAMTCVRCVTEMWHWTVALGCGTALLLVPSFPKLLGNKWLSCGSEIRLSTLLRYWSHELALNWPYDGADGSELILSLCFAHAFEVSSLSMLGFWGCSVGPASISRNFLMYLGVFLGTLNVPCSTWTAECVSPQCPKINMSSLSVSGIPLVCENLLIFSFIINFCCCVLYYPIVPPFDHLSFPQLVIDHFYFQWSSLLQFVPLQLLEFVGFVGCKSFHPCGFQVC